MHHATFERDELLYFENDNNETCEDEKDGKYRNFFISVNSDIVIYKKAIHEEHVKATLWIRKIENMIIGLNATTKIFQFEVGEETHILHYHVYLNFPNTKRFSTIKKIFPKGKIITFSKDWMKVKEYCVKKDTRYHSSDKSDAKEIEDLHIETNREKYEKIILQETHIEEYYPWQLKIKEILEGPVDKRKIYWIYDLEGNNGKSYFCKHLMLRKGKWGNIRYFCSGKLSDITFSIKQDVQNYTIIKNFIFDIPRCKKDYIDFELLENLKNGSLFSAKYESYKLRVLIPTIIIFANSPPKQLNNLSIDRWDIREIKNKDLLECKLDTGYKY